ncbi:phage baseplate assembly protein V [Dactylosporangium darangshiense]|uniref:Gp5/Type VI secretion system Vgr protein OB-fold domain-containing protein n=1 Tax=Dactylosporangium darangshiense TaxID=579108 RepID=A0ABP8D9A9_9ACTN
MMPAVDVTVAGAPLAATCRVVAVRVAARLSRPTQCELTLDDPDARALELLGAPLVLRVAGDDGPLFDGEVTGVDLVRGADGETGTRIVAYDRLHRLRKRQTLRCLERLDAADLAGVVCDGLGVTVRAEERGPRFERVVQHRRRDLELLTETLERVGLYVALDGDELRVLTLEGHGAPLALRYGRNLHRVEVSASLERAAAVCAAMAWRPRTADVLTASAEHPRAGRDIALRPRPATDGGAATLTLVDEAAASDDELLAVAQGALDASAARTVVLDAVAAGDAALRPGRRVRADGLAEALDGTYVLTEVVTTIDADGYLAELSTRPPARRLPNAATSLSLGEVTDVADPDGCGRVRVALGAHGGLDLGWLAVLVPGAGDGRGLVVLPDVGDPVLVALPHDATGDAVVLGGLYGTTPAPDRGGVSGGGVRRWSMRTAGGQSVVVDDERRSLRLQNAAGSYVELTPDLLRLHAETDLLLDAPGRGVTVRAASVDFDHSPIAIPGGTA